jgi:Mg-dependent DNase
MLKKHQFKLGGIAHAFSGGVEEAKAFTKLGFKIGVTGQITNPNAKKLHQVVQTLGAASFGLRNRLSRYDTLMLSAFDGRAYP